MKTKQIKLYLNKKPNLKISTKKLLAVVLLGSMATMASAYSFTVNNQSNYDLKVYNGFTQDTHYINAGTTQTLELQNSYTYQISYTYTNYYKQAIPDQLGSISQDNNTQAVSINLQQPSAYGKNPFPPTDPRAATTTVIPWQAVNVTIANQNFGSTPLYNWPDAANLNGCSNATWGTTCTGTTSGSITFNNNPY